MKTALKIVGAVLALLILAIIAIPFLVPVDALKSKVAEELSKATGRDVKIEGEASLKIFPDIAISLKDVSLGNPKGDFKSARLFYARQLDTGVKLMPLFDKHIIITGLTIDGAEIQLEETKTGAKNWELTSRSSSETKQEQTREEGKSGVFAIGEVKISDSSLSFRPASGDAIELSAIQLTVNGADGSEPLALDGGAVYRGEQVNLSLDVKDSQGFMQGDASPMMIEATVPGGNFNFNGTARHSSAMHAQGDMKLNIAAMPKLMKWATGSTPSEIVPEKIMLHGPVVVDGKKIRFTELDARADDLHARGKLTVDATGNVPSIQGNLKLGLIDLARFSKSPEAQGTAPAAGAEKGWSREPIDLSGLKAVNAKLGLALDGVKMGKLTLGATAMDVNLQNGALNVGIDNMALYDGNASGKLALSSTAYSTAMAIKGVQIEPLMEALSGASRLKGTAAFNVNLRGNGTNQYAMVNSLDGTATFIFTNGAIKGINLAQFLRDAKKGFLFDSPREETDFAELGGSFNFANGIGTTNDLAMKAPVIRLNGNGTVNLPNQSLNMKLMPTLVASLKGQGGKEKDGLTIPLLVTGSWSNPSVTPDVRGIVEDAIRNPEQFKSNLKNIKEGIKDFNSPSDIGKALLGGGTAASTSTSPAAEQPTAVEESTSTAPAPTPAPKKDAKQQAIEGLFNALSN